MEKNHKRKKRLGSCFLVIFLDFESWKLKVSSAKEDYILPLERISLVICFPISTAGCP